MIRGELEVRSHFAAFERELYLATTRALDKTAEGAVARVHASPVPADYRIQAILDSTIRSGVERTSKGAGVWLIARDWRSLFFELGTYQRRKRKLKGSRRSTGANKGVYPAYFLLHASDWAKKELPGRIAEEHSLIRLL